MAVVSIPNVWGMIDQLVTQGLQPWASRAFCDSAKEVDWCKFHLHIMLGLQVIKTLKEKKARIIVIWVCPKLLLSFLLKFLVIFPLFVPKAPPPSHTHTHTHTPHPLPGLTTFDPNATSPVLGFRMPQHQLIFEICTKRHYSKQRV